MMMEDTPCSNLTFCLCITKIEKDGTLCLWKIILWIWLLLHNLETWPILQWIFPWQPPPPSTWSAPPGLSPTLDPVCITAHTIDILECHIQEQAPTPRPNIKKNKITHRNKCAKTQTCPASMANFSVLSKNRASSVSSVASRCFATNLNLKIDPHNVKQRGRS